MPDDPGWWANDDWEDGGYEPESIPDDEPEWLHAERRQAMQQVDEQWSEHIATFDPTEKEPPKRPVEVAKAEPETDRSSWWPVHNVASADDLTPPEPPTIICRDDGIGLFYPGTINGVHGESGDGKSWLMQAGALQEMQAGHHVWYLDFESRYDKVTQRLFDLGADWDAISPFWHYSSPAEPLVVKDKWTKGGIDLMEGLEVFDPNFVVIDGVTEAMDLHGLNPLDNADYATFRRMLLARIADTGACCATVDHVNKDPDTRNNQAMGAQHKRAGMTGATYNIVVSSAFARGKDGMLKVVCAKDREGFWAKGKTVVEAHATTGPDGSIDIDFRTPSAPASQADDFRPTNIMEKVSRYLEGEPTGASKRAIRTNVRGKNPFIDRAIEVLSAEGFIDPTTHVSLKPYRQSTIDTEGQAA